MFKEKIEEAIKVPSFDDIYILPSLSPIEPSQVDLTTMFTTSIPLKIPLVSSPMDTITELDMAVAMALLGGIGVIHRNMERERQLEIAKKVKEYPPIKLRWLYADIDEPCIRAVEILRKMALRNLPVIDKGFPVGYIHIENLSECRNFTTPIKNYVAPGKSFRVSEIGEASQNIIKGKYDSLAIVSRSGEYLGTLVYSDVIEEYMPVLDNMGRLIVAAAISPFDVERAKVLDKYVDAIVSDVAHFHNVEVLKNAKKVVSETSIDFVAGNIGSEQAVEDSLSIVERVDGFRVGIGGGSICTTPEITGAYSPTLWAVASVKDALKKNNARIPVIADGGIRGTGDIVKALSVGASSVMLGYMLAGTDEAPVPFINIGENAYKPYRGMASRGAMERRFAVDRYSRVNKKVPEGVEGLVPYRGSVYGLVGEMVEAIKAGLGYAGSRNIEELWNKSKFIVATKKRNRNIKTDH
ncbi:MAG: IMP dehydrogenase [Desulfurococcaceae archaeon]